MPSRPLLLQAGADLELRDAGGLTPLDNAAEAGSQGALAALLAAGARVLYQPATTRHPHSALHAAVVGADHGCMLQLLAAGAAVDAQTARLAPPCRAAGSHCWAFRVLGFRVLTLNPKPCGAQADATPQLAAGLCWLYGPLMSALRRTYACFVTGAHAGVHSTLTLTAQGGACHGAGQKVD